TIGPDIPRNDPRVRAGWPCHGPVPWPDEAYREAMTAFMHALGGVGERGLELTAPGLGPPHRPAPAVPTRGGGDPPRAQRTPGQPSETTARGIEAQTSRGLLAIVAQDNAGGLCVRAPVAGDHDDAWTHVKPVPGVLAVLPGDILHFMTGRHLPSTAHE